jgi:hypothetical protein
MATMEKILVKRKCNLQGQSGDFALVRKNVKQSIVRAIDAATGQLGPEESVDTALVSNERKYEAPKAPKEDKEYAADRPERKVCLINGRGNTRFHLLRQGADYCKVLEVGTAGKGEWVLHKDIADKFMVPSTTRPRYIPRQPIRICQVEGREGNYLLLRQTTKGARIIGPIVGENYGETIDANLITGEQKIMLKRNKATGEQGTVTETAVIVGSEPPVAEAPPVIPQADSPVHGHHPAAGQPTQLPAQAPVQQVAPVQQRPAQVPPQQRPADPRMQPGARPQQVPQRPAPVR